MSASSPPKFACASCGKQYTWKPELAGRKAKCKCGEVMTVPKAVGANAAAAAKPVARPAVAKPAAARPAAAGVIAATGVATPKPKPAARPDPEPDFDAAFDDMGGDGAYDDVATAPPAAPPPYKPSGKAAGASASPGAAAGKPADGERAASSGGLVDFTANMIPDNDNWKWWYYLIAGSLMVPVAFYQYFRLLDYENGEDTLKLKSFERILYGIFGKWGVCGFLVTLGAIMIFIGYAKWQKERNNAAAAAA